MTRKLKESIDRKFIYQVTGNYNNFLNILYTLDVRRIIENEDVESLKGYPTTFKNFLIFCKEYEVDPENFLLNNPNYILTTEEVYTRTVHWDSYGLSMKHRIDDQVKYYEEHDTEIWDRSDVYNFVYNKEKGSIKYAYLKQDFINVQITPYERDLCWKNDRSFHVQLSKQQSLRLKDYIMLGLYDFEIQIENEECVGFNQYAFDLYTPGTKMADLVYSDFCYFEMHNKLSCPTCGKLVDNAFDEYMVQFYKHDGC